MLANRRLGLTVYLSSRALELPVQDALVSQDEGKHDLVTARLESGDIEQARQWQGAPVIFRWGERADPRTIYGYVDTVGSEDGVLTVHVLGMTNVCRNGRPRQWLKTLPFVIAQQILEPYRLGLEMDQDIHPLDSFIQTDDSDWKALVRLANQIGMTVISDNGVVRIVDVRKELSRASRRALPRYRIEKSDSGAGSPAMHYTFLDTYQPVGHDRYRFSGVDRLGQTFEITGGDENGVLRHREVTFQSLTEAMSAGRQWEDRTRLRQQATVHGAGLSRVSAGSAVLVAEEDPSAGPWYVMAARHMASKRGDLYKTELALQRPVGRRVAAPDRPTMVRPSPVLREGKWCLPRQYIVET